MSRLIKLSLRGMIISLWVTVANYVGIFIKLKPKIKKSPKPTILLVRGWRTQTLPYVFMKNYFEDRGYRFLIQEDGWMFGDLEKYTEKLNTFVKERNLKDFVIIGSSIGGVVALNYIKKYDRWRKVNKLITIATPFRGTPMGFFSLITKSARQIVPVSKFIKELDAENINGQKNILCIRAKLDELVPNKRSAFLPNAKNVEIDIIGHGNVHFSKETYREIEKFIG